MPECPASLLLNGQHYFSQPHLSMLRFGPPTWLSWINFAGARKEKQYQVPGGNGMDHRDSSATFGNQQGDHQSVDDLNIEWTSWQERGVVCYMFLKTNPMTLRLYSVVRCLQSWGYDIG